MFACSADNGARETEDKGGEDRIEAPGGNEPGRSIPVPCVYTQLPRPSPVLYGILIVLPGAGGTCEEIVAS